jgi:hypothetical protein
VQDITKSLLFNIVDWAVMMNQLAANQYNKNFPYFSHGMYRAITVAKHHVQIDSLKFVRICSHCNSCSRHRNLLCPSFRHPHCLRLLVRLTSGGCNESRSNVVSCSCMLILTTAWSPNLRSDFARQYKDLWNVYIVWGQVWNRRVIL